MHFGTDNIIFIKYDHTRNQELVHCILYDVVVYFPLFWFGWWVVCAHGRYNMHRFEEICWGSIWKNSMKTLWHKECMELSPHGVSFALKKLLFCRSSLEVQVIILIFELHMLSKSAQMQWSCNWVPSVLLHVRGWMEEEEVCMCEVWLSLNSCVIQWLL